MSEVLRSRGVGVAVGANLVLDQLFVWNVHQFDKRFESLGYKTLLLKTVGRGIQKRDYATVKSAPGFQH